MNLLPRTLKNTIALCAIIFLGFVLRFYHLGFPSIGYHNMQENVYMGIAHEMEKTGDYVTKRVYFYDAFGEKTGPKPSPQFPLVSYQTVLSWKFLGENLWGPRLINVIFGLGGILLIYRIAILFFTDKRLALFASLLSAIMPLAVFFSRNLQPESPALFFMLLGSLFYLRFIPSQKRYNLLFGGLSFLMAWLYKFNFLIGVFPFLFCFREMADARNKKKFMSYLSSLVFPFFVIAVFIFLLYRSGQISLNVDAGRLLRTFLPSYWKEYGRTVWWYIKDENFTPVFITLSLIGMIIAFLKRESLVERYIMGWAIAIIPYCIFFSEPISQNNYYQMPFLALVCVSAAYAASFISAGIKKVVKRDVVIIVLMAISVLSIPFVRDSIMRMHSTVFAGVDVAGESLRDFTKPDERIFLLTHSQGYGIARYAGRYAGWTYDLEDFKDKEKKFGVRYVCIYPVESVYSLKENSPELFNYIQTNYHMKEAGLTDEPERLFYLILEKGETPRPQNILESISGKKYLKTIYRVSGKYIFFYVLKPQGTA
ncbi:MAG: hypothetical protein A2Z72_02780 [Omnitrophica bacterium RBG_13_46_9]|nr:MAG: hypothetical protein A2Z72_02780 [Omnitrophica bacterium RBG_13_46_9]